MTKHEHFRSPEVAAKLSSFALRALTVVSTELKSTLHTKERLIRSVEESALQALLEAAICQDRRPFERAVSELMDQGATFDDFANDYVPAIARRLGEYWVQDRLNFVSVTIGCARLQGYLRQNGLNWPEAGQFAHAPASTVLLTVPDFEQHTLGATLLTEQLRARGVFVKLELQVPTDEIERLASQGEYDAVLISSSQNETLELLTPFVSNSRNGAGQVPIILGGNVLEQTPDVLSATGADYTAQDWQGALELIKVEGQNKKAGSTALRYI